MPPRARARRWQAALIACLALAGASRSATSLAASATEKPARAVRLPESPWRYFQRTPGAKLFPLAALRAGQPFAAAKAGQYMRLAYDGQMERRTPVKLRDNRDGTFTLLDGKSTFWNARQNGWRNLVGVVTE